ncbi:hypothetical protein IGS67_08230 [Flavimobilis sp. GY10621]|uniref:Uncharacterized protein n=1 Tax=Flavimobilis rhizosphaerae TaxID=2775421 RepID=A0ABR9DTY9_9MICO|nr:hypothetical protein [Flavimobilis rhizosphaerae]MBD9699475.1 hypothetical protein [Flavimobilis rhizosphaerae]
MTSLPPGPGPDPFLPPPGVAQSHGFRAGLPPHRTTDRPVSLALRILEEIFRGLAALIAIVSAVAAVLLVGVITLFMITGTLTDSAPFDPTDRSRPSLWSLKPLISVSVATVAALLIGFVRKVADDRAAPPPWAPVTRQDVARRAHAAGLTAAVVLAPLAWLNFAAAVFVTFPLELPPDVIREVATPLLTAATALTVAAITLALTYPRRRAGRRRQRHATASRAS